LGAKNYKSKRLRLLVLAALAVLVAGIYWLSLPGPQRIGNNSRLYVGSFTSDDGRGIYLFRLNATGKLDAAGLAAGGRLWQTRPIARSRVPSRVLGQIRADWPDVKSMFMGVHDPANLTVHPNGRYLYTANQQSAGNVSAFQIDRETGKLTLLNTESSGGEFPASLSVDSTGHFLLVANFGGSVAVIPIDPNGRLRPVTSVLQQKNDETDSSRVSHPHAIVLSPDNRFAVVPNTLLDRVFVYKFDAKKGELAASNPAFMQVPPGSSPRHFVFAPNGQFGYAVGESGSCVLAMRWDAELGVFTLLQTISTLPPGYQGQNSGADIAIDPSGRFLYASNRGHDSIAVFAVDQATGKLYSVQIESSFGAIPINLLIDPSGSYLFAANASSNTVVKFHIDPQTGRLDPIESVRVPSPRAMVLLPPE
jgi:6-phosphogluconolactonase